MASYDFDLFTIGAGSGGVRASRISAGYGARVAVAEERDLGGTCVNVGCIPKKLLVYASAFRRDVEDAAGFGWTAPSPAHDWKTLIANKDAEISRLNGVYGRLLDAAGVKRIEGRARLVDAHTVEVAGERFTAEHILVATGSWPSLPETPGIEHAISSNEAFHLDAMPERPIVVGGGYIAVEFAGILHGLGAEVTQLYRGPLFLRGFDEDVRAHLANEMRGQGIDLRFESDIERIERASDGGLRATLRCGTRLEGDAILYATGRRPLTADLGLEEAGVKVDRGHVVIDQWCATGVPGVYAIGDLAGPPWLAHKASHEGIVCVEHIAGVKGVHPLDTSKIPGCTYCTPQVASVGMTEAMAKAEGREVKVGRFPFIGNGKAIALGEPEGLVKTVFDARTGELLGAHMIGAEVTELIQGYGIARTLESTEQELIHAVFPHPTLSEMMHESVLDAYGRVIHI